MVKIGNVALNRVPRIAIAISDKEDNRSIKSSEVDIVEVRLDQFESLDSRHIKNSIIARKELGIPLILTIRSKAEGGARHITDRSKLKIFEDTISLVDAVDIELRSSIVSKVIALAKKNKKVAIVSWHDFKSTPDNRTLVGILRKAKKLGADIVKIAAKANKAEDIVKLLEFTRANKDKNIITISLGSIGAISRLFFPMVGSLITYSYISQPSGSGQLPLEILREQLRLYYPQYNQAFIKKSGIIENA